MEKQIQTAFQGLGLGLYTDDGKSNWKLLSSILGLYRGHGNQLETTIYRVEDLGESYMGYPKH